MGGVDVRRTVAGFLGGLILAGGTGWAQEQSGALVGRVRDPGGTALAGARVEASSVSGGRWTMSAADGSFSLPPLLPGTWSVLATTGAGGRAEVEGVEVRLGRTTRLDIVIAPPATGEVTVVASAERLGTSGGAHTSSLSAATVDRLPHDRSYLSILPVLPGVANEPEAAGISIDGSSGAENKVYLDGVDTTSPQKGTPAGELVLDFAAEVQVKSAGATAEYGGSTGGVINVVTRTGGDSLHGSLGARYEPGSLAGDVRPTLELDETGTYPRYTTYRADDTRRLDPALTLSGPLRRERAWFFLGYERGILSTERTVDFANGVRRAFDQEFSADFLSLDLTAALGKSGFFKAAVHHSPSATRRSLPDPSGRGSADPADYRPGLERDNDAAALLGDMLLDGTWQLAGRATFFRTDYHSTGIRDTGTAKSFSGASPGIFPEVPPELVRPAGFSTGPAYALWDHDEYRRTALWLDAARDLDGFGRHTLKAGVQAERIENSVLRDASATSLEFQWATGDAYVGERAHGRYGALAVYKYQTAGEVRTDNVALFLQDTWRPSERLTIELGLRAEREQVPDYRLGHEGEHAIEFGFGDKLAPRFGFSWDPRGRGDTRLYGSWGRYFDVTKYELARLSFGSERRVRYVYALNSYDWLGVDCQVAVNDPARPPDCGPGIDFVTAVNLRNPSNDAIDPGLRPTESREWQIGVEQRLGRVSRLSARYLHKELVRVIEDIGAYVEGVGEVYVIGNPGEGVSRFAVAGVPLPRPRRDYDAVELTFERRLEGSWSLLANYTWSRLYGNFPGLASSDENGRAAPNVLRAYDGWFSLFGEDGRPVYGPLGTDRPHQLKLAATWRAPFGTTVGIFQYVGSGTPRTSVAFRYQVPFYPYGRGDLGRNPTLTQTDLRLAHGLPVGRATLELAVTVLNLFDEDTVLEVSEGLHGSSLNLTDAQFLAGFDTRALIDEQNLRHNPTYGMAGSFQAPRRVLLSAALRF